MAIGELGLPLDLAVQLVDGELKLTLEFATTQHRQMGGLHALDWLLKVLDAMCSYALVVKKIILKLPGKKLQQLTVSLIL
jgi:hypothetical protein